MKSFLILALSLLGFSACCFAQPGSDVLWSCSFGGELDDSFGRVRLLADGNYLAVGTRNNLWASDLDPWLVKFTPNGDTLWTRSYPEPYDDIGLDVQEAAGGDLWMLQTIMGGGLNVTHLSATGEVLGVFGDWYHSGVVFSGWIFPRLEGGCYIAGGDIPMNEETWEEYPNTYVHAWDAAGNLLWSRSNYAVDGVYGYQAKRTADGGWIFAGYQRLWMGGGVLEYNFGYAKRDANGYLEWQQVIVQPGEARAVDVAPTPDGGYLFLGFHYPQGTPGPRNIYLVRANAAGDSLWTRTLESPLDQRPVSIEPVPGGGYLLAGVHTVAAGEDDALLIQLDAGGNALWSRTYGGPGRDAASVTAPLADGAIWVGYANNPPNQRDGWIVRTGTMPVLPSPEQLVIWLAEDAWHLRWNSTGSPYYRIYAEAPDTGAPVLLDWADDTTYTFPAQFHLPSCRFFVTGSTEQ